MRYEERGMKVTIDRDRCTGHGRCYATAAGVFVDDDAGYGQLVGDGTVPAGQEDAARRAAVACPEQAITVDE
jgi:ferredoxin